MLGGKVMSTPNLMELRKKLVSLRQSFIGQKGALGNLSANTKEGKAWLEWAGENTDRFREELNQIIEYLDQIIGK